MPSDLQQRSGALSEREKETLRLLLAGHDAKSAARELGLSVHTINERLRDSRRKLGVSSSREAARVLAEAERETPGSVGDNSLGDKGFGVAGKPIDMGRRWQGDGRFLAWLVGGLLVMLTIIVAAVLSPALSGNGPVDGSRAERRPAAATGDAAQSAGAAAALDWAALVDAGRWDDSWRAAAAIFRSQVTAQQWAESVRPVRQPLGAVASRTVQSVTRTTTLPGAPAGEYEVVLLETSFAQRTAIETVVMMRENGSWKVSGYFIR